MKKRQMLEGHGTHHPYCKFTYENSEGAWRCACDFLKDYDRWRRLLLEGNDEK